MYLLHRVLRARLRSGRGLYFEAEHALHFRQIAVGNRFDAAGKVVADLEAGMSRPDEMGRGFVHLPYFDRAV